MRGCCINAKFDPDAVFEVLRPDAVVCGLQIRTPVRVTTSFGVASFAPPFHQDYSTMIAVDDAKLYESKRNRRNRVTA